MKKLRLTKIENNIFLFFLIFIILSSSINLLSHLNFENTSQNKTLEILNCKSFTFSFSEKIDLDDKEVLIIKKDVYVFPEIKNILCLGRYSSIYSDDINYFINTYSNSKFINILIFIFNFTIVISKSFFNIPKKKFLIIYFLFNFYFLTSHFFSINLTSLNFMFVPITSYYFFNKISDED